jgi:hypothetical protein
MDQRDLKRYPHLFRTSKKTKTAKGGHHAETTFIDPRNDPKDVAFIAFETALYRLEIAESAADAAADALAVAVATLASAQAVYSALDSLPLILEVSQ